MQSWGKHSSGGIRLFGNKVMNHACWPVNQAKMMQPSWD
ncbi:hypothetical protein EcE22_5310 [Escherichia coli E22]|nr:hypothetical protein EcE22_5310 [Escherichia coli E22]